MATITNYINLRGNMVKGMKDITAATEESTQKLGILSGRVSHLNNKFKILRGSFSTMAGVIMGNVLVSGATAALGAITSFGNKVFETSEEFAAIQARIGLIVDTEKDVVMMNDMIYQSAQRARGGYLDMAHSVSQLALSAKDAFPDPRQAVNFMEGVQKLFVVGGANKEAQRNAMLQLTQAMASGRLQGDEFRSIAENAPLIENIIAEYMGVSRGQLKELAAEGQITSDVIKNAILGSMNKIDAQFDKMPKKWGDHFTNLYNVAIRAFTGIYKGISHLANSDFVRQIVTNLTNAIVIVAAVVTGVATLIVGVGDTCIAVFGGIANWMPVITAAVFGLAAAWAIYNAELLITEAREVALATWSAITNGWLVARKTIVALVTAATITWNLVTGGAITMQSILAGVVAFLSGNLLTIAAIIVGVVVAAYALWAGASGNLADMVADAMDFIIDVTEVAANAGIKFVNAFIKVLNTAAERLNDIFGLKLKKAELVGEVSFQGAKEWTGAIREGKFMQKLQGSFGLDDFTNSKRDVLEEIAGNTGDTAGHTKGIKDALDHTEEDLQFLKEAAEREAINKYTTATVKIDVGGLIVENNERRDFDGMLRHLTEAVEEAVISGAEAVKA